MLSYIRTTILTVLSFLMLFSLSLPAAAETAITKAAIVNMIFKETKTKVAKPDIIRMVNAAFKEAKKNSIDPFLIISLIKIESSFRHRIRNSYGASGLMQVVQRFHRDKIKGRNIMNIETNIEVGTKILADCLDRYDGHIRKASRCYSGNAKNYASKLKLGHNEVRKADILYRFENNLPLIAADSSFESPSKFSISASTALDSYTVTAAEELKPQLLVASSIY